jgi:hypothetical protein
MEGWMAPEPEGDALARALAHALRDVRPTSRFAIETFLRAVATDGVIGAELRISYDHRRGHLECESHVGAPEATTRGITGAA